MNITIKQLILHVHNETDPTLTQTLTDIMTAITAVRIQGAHMSETVDALKAEVAAIENDLSVIQRAVASALAANTAQAQVIADQKATIDALQAGDVLTAQQLADLKASTDAVVAHADAVAASLSPVAPPSV